MLTMWQILEQGVYHKKIRRAKPCLLSVQQILEQEGLQEQEVNEKGNPMFTDCATNITVREQLMPTEVAFTVNRIEAIFISISTSTYVTHVRGVWIEHAKHLTCVSEFARQW